MDGEYHSVNYHLPIRSLHIIEDVLAGLAGVLKCYTAVYPALVPGILPAVSFNHGACLSASF